MLHEGTCCGSALNARAGCGTRVVDGRRSLFPCMSFVWSSNSPASRNSSSQSNTPRWKLCDSLWLEREPTFVWTMQDFLGVVCTMPIEFHTRPIRPRALFPLTLHVIKCALKRYIKNPVLSADVVCTNLCLVGMDPQVFGQIVHGVESSLTSRPQTTRRSQSRKCEIDGGLKLWV